MANQGDALKFQHDKIFQSYLSSPSLNSSSNHLIPVRRHGSKSALTFQIIIQAAENTMMEYKQPKETKAQERN